MKEVKERVAVTMSITDEDRKDLLPSGKQSIYDNRLGWTRTYLKKAGLIDSPARALFVITDEGKKVLSENPAVINDAFLKRYESFREFMNPDSGDGPDVNGGVSEETPQDKLDNAFKLIQSKLADDLMSEIMKQSPAFFEELVVNLLKSMGYGGAVQEAGMVIGKSGDEGIDGIIREDKLGFNLIYIQAKRWEIDKTIGRPEIQRFVGALAGQGATKGLFITTGRFSKEALDYAKKQHTTKVILVDGSMLTSLMIDHNLGVSTESVYQIKRVDMDFFSDEVS